MNQKITQTILSFEKSFDNIPLSRKNVLENFAKELKQHLSEHRSINLIFICTHNSRRSHLAHIWAQVAAHFYGIKDVYCYSGGTEATALYPTVASTLEKQGFNVVKLSESDNSVFSFNYSNHAFPIVVFSKVYDNTFNPQNNFFAVMVCDNADENCPFIPSAIKRISLTFKDPKEFDGTSNEEKGYLERSTLIGTELFYAFSLVKS